MLWAFLILFGAFSDLGNGLSTLKIGIVVSEDDRGGGVEFGYKFGIDVINRDKSLPNASNLVPYTIYVKTGDTFRASKRLCEILENGVVALLGQASDKDPSLEMKLYWTSATLDVPLFFATPSFHTRQKISAVDSGLSSVSEPEFSIRLAPSLEIWNVLLKEMITYLKIDGLALIYENHKGLMKMQAMLREPVIALIEQMIVRKVEPNVDSYRQVFSEIQNREIRHIIIDCAISSLPELLLKTIVRHKMTDYKYHFIVTNFDMAVANLSSFIKHNVNLTTFQITDYESRYFKEKVQEMSTFLYDNNDDFNPLVFNENNSPSILAETALAFDSVLALGMALNNLDSSHTFAPANMSCEKDTPWQDGLSLLNYINAVDFKGLTGPIAFKEGDRSNLKINIVRLNEKGMKKIGHWSYDNHLNITEPKYFWDNGSSNVSLVVTAVLESPYIRIKLGDNLIGNDRFEGFSVDLLSTIAQHVGFKYTLEIVPDGKYGVADVNGEWNGVVRWLIDKKADLAIGSMTINYARESVIDFTKPFMNLGISILFKIPSRPPARLFSFLNPLAIEIWIAVLVSYFLVSFTMFVVSRFSPYEWSIHTATITHTQDSSIGIVRNQFNFSNAFWYPIGTLMQQGTDLNPKSTSTRLIGGFWWFFSLVIISSYTANLAAFLTVERMSTPIESAEDLAEQSEIAYGTLDSGSTMTFFKNSRIETYQKMWRFMESRKPSVFVSTYDEGIKRVLEGNYAFLMESTTLDYEVQQNCNLTQIGGLLDNKGFGVATPVGSPWRDKISLAILEMQEKGIIQLYYNKWWRNKTNEKNCNRDLKDSAAASALGFDSIGGVFVVLLIGLFLSILVAIMEFCWHAKSNSNTDLCSEMAEEARFAFRCRGPRRRPDLDRHCYKCNSNENKTPRNFRNVHDSTYPHQHHVNHSINGLHS